MRLVIPLEDPDIDGVASAYAYAEFLKNQDVKAVSAVFGDVDEDTQAVLEELDENISDASYYLYSADEITLVSASSMTDVSSRIPEEKVTEVIDHVNVNTDAFSQAEIEINEDAGTAATMITQKFMDEEMEITRESAKLLLAAVNSAEEPTELDGEAADWLEQQLD